MKVSWTGYRLTATELCAMRRLASIPKTAASRIQSINTYCRKKYAPKNSTSRLAMRANMIFKCFIAVASGGDLHRSRRNGDAF
ncbi:hypothetical protein ABTF08_19500, partial [Acinetobacter baumannii]